MNTFSLSLTVGLLMTSPLRADDFDHRELELDGETVRYRLLPPTEVVDGERYPLVLFLHGLGERGSDNERHLRHFPERMVTTGYRDRYRAFVLAPQCPGDDLWIGGDFRSRRLDPPSAPPTNAMSRAIAALQETVREEPIDPRRIYLTGLSLGGFGSWDLGIRRPEWFAGVLPVCGGGDPAFVHRLVDTPLWTWHGKDDRTVPARYTEALVERLRELGGSPKFELLDGVGHHSWNQAYGDEAGLDWLFEQQLGDGYPRTPGLTALRSEANRVPDDARVLFLGDSITEGGAQPGGYVDRIKQALLARDPDVEVIGAGISGNKVTDLEARLERDVLSRKPTHVFVYIGINDVWHGLSGRGTDESTFRDTLEAILVAMGDAGARCIVATPSVIGEKPDGDNKLDDKLDRYAEISRSVAAKLELPICDLRRAMTDYLRIFNRDAADRGILTRDTVHLNEAGNRFVADHAARALFESWNP